MTKVRRHHVVWSLLIGLMCANNASGDFSDLEKEILDVQKFMIRKLLPLAQDAIVDTETSASCAGAMLKLLNGIRNREAWALKFLTSNAGIPSAALYFTTGALGHYGMCVSSKGPVDESTTKPIFTGKFCSLYFTSPSGPLNWAWNIIKENGDVHPSAMLPSIVDSSYLRVRIRFGVCVPSTCETEELNALISHVANKYEYESEVSGCRTLADESERTPTFYVAICTFGCLVILVALSTTAEHLQWGKSGDFSCVFSLISNNKHLFAATTEKNQALAFLNGVKALLSFWIVLGHTYFMVDAYTIYTLKEAYDAMKSVFAQFVITGAFLGVTTFFCISGFLFTRGLISYKGPSIPAVFIYVVFMVRRYVRLTVPSAAVILFGYIMRAWVNGPTADGAFRVYTEACDTNWWRIFALANNFATLENMCWYHYWFMSVDMQIFSVALVFALMMPRRPKLAITILVLCALYSCIWIIDTSHRNKLQAAPIINENWAQLSRFLYLMYVKAFTHFNACVIGLLAGFVYVKAYDMYISKTVQCVSAVLCFVVMVTMILATLPFYYYIPVPRYIELFYAGFHRIVWSVAVSWLFFLMGTNRMQWLSRTLSLRLFVVLGRLSFSTYLIHVPLLTYYMGINTVYVQIEHSKMLRTAIGNYVISVALAYILHMMVEAPTMQVEARLFRFIKKAEMKQAQNDNKNPDLHLSDVKVHSATKL